MVRLLSALLLAVVSAGPAGARSYKVASVYRGTPGVESFGFAIAADGDRVLIGAVGDRPGAIYYFEGDVLRHRLEPLPSNGSFGAAVALAGPWLIVGSPSEMQSGYQRGAVRVYDAASGTLVRTFPNPSPVSQTTGFGSALAVVGNEVLIGGTVGFALDPPADMVYVYDLATGALVRTYADPAGPDLTHGFGASLAPLGDRIVIGSPGYRTSVSEDAYGRAYVLDAESGALLRTIENPEPNVTRDFGRTLAVVGGLVAIGSPNVGRANNGAAHLVDPLSGAFVRTLRRPFPGDPDNFGRALAPLGSELLVGSPSADGGRVPGGDLAYLFDVATGGVSALLSPTGLSEFGRTAATADGDLLVYGDEGDLASGSGAVLRFTLACGDGVLDACERCDDGNTNAGDGCDPDCRLESCGDGVRDPGEACDDGNAIVGDGCDPDCSVSGCGNCQVGPGEECDDGNATVGDGCDPGCTATRCGNGVVSATEECDDGNAVEGDGCTPVCQTERCGNGRIEAGESCDGNTEYPEECVDCRLVGPDLAAWKPAFELSLGIVDPLLQRPALAATARYLAAVIRTPGWVNGDPLPIVPEAKVFDRTSGAEVGRLDVAAPRTLATLGGDFLVGEVDAGQVHLFAGDTLALGRTFLDPTPSTGPFGLSLHASGDRLVVQDAGDAAVHVFDVATGAALCTLAEPAPGGDPAAFGATVLDLGAFLVVSGERAVHVFERATGAFVRSLTPPAGAALAGPRTAALDGFVLIPDAAGDVLLFDPATGNVVHTFARPPRLDDRPPAVAVTANDVVIGGFGVVRVFARDTRALRHTITPLVTSSTSCFGAVVAPFDAGLVVGDPCLSNGPIGVFDDAGKPLSVLRMFENMDYLRGPHLTYGSTFLATLEFGDYHLLRAYRPCTDGVLRAGEECDDGNLTSGDGCDVNCTETRCGNGVVAGDETCDPYALPLVEQCSTACVLGACPDAVVLEDARVAIRRARPPAGDERIVFSGRLRHTSGAPVEAAPARTGAQILIEGGGGTPLVALTTPSFPIVPGPRGSGCGARDGWRTDAHRDVYVNHSDAVGICTPGSAQGLRRLALTRRARGDATVRARFAPTTVAGAPDSLRVRLGYDFTPLTQFPGPCHGSPSAELACRTSSSGSFVECR